MNLQRGSGDVSVTCVKCSERFVLATGYADLDGKAFTDYYCRDCAFVIRFVPTYLDARTGLRTLINGAQGRNTYATAAEAQAWLDAVMGGTSADRIRELWGTDPQFQIRECECWPGHHDPKGIYFD